MRLVVGTHPSQRSKRCGLDSNASDGFRIVSGQMQLWSRKKFYCYVNNKPTLQVLNGIPPIIQYGHQQDVEAA